MNELFFEIMLVEDNPGDERLIRELLKETNYLRANIISSSTLACGLDLVAKSRFDIILLDLNLPDSSGIETVITAHAAAPDIPILVLTGLDDDSVGAEAVRCGAQDYLVKCNLEPNVLARLIYYASERHKSKKDLLNSEYRLRHLIQNNADGILVLDASGEILFANGAAESLFDKSSADLLHSQFPFPVPGDRISQVVMQDQEGQEAHIELSIVFDFEWEGKSALLVSLRDVTERITALNQKQRLEEQLQQSQKMESIGMLAGGIAHDFNNMLTAINANAHLALRNIEKGNPPIMELKEILAAADRAGDLTSKLLTFARKDKPNTQNGSLRDIADSVANLLERTISKKIVIRKQYAPDAPPVKVDSNQLHQAILNICTNACDAMPQGGALSIELQHQVFSAQECAKIGLRQSGHYVLLEISDTGTGMPARIKSKIFEPFFTTKGVSKGTGLGLSVTIGIVQNHGGIIDVSSEPGRGSRFVIYLPAAQTQESPEDQAQATPTLKTGTETILIVDDEMQVLKSISHLLQALDYKILTASSGREALSSFIDNMKEIDLVILDFMMPEMDGRDVYNAISKLSPDTPVVLCTGYSTDGAAGELLSRGVREVISKPFSLLELSHTIRRVLDPSTIHA